MLRHRYIPTDWFQLVPALGMEVDPIFMRLDGLLDDDTLVQMVKTDLAQRFPRTLIDGRPSTPVEVILRMLVIKHLYDWSYAQTEQWVPDSLVLRQSAASMPRACPTHHAAPLGQPDPAC